MTTVLAEAEAEDPDWIGTVRIDSMESGPGWESIGSCSGGGGEGVLCMDGVVRFLRFEIIPQSLLLNAAVRWARLGR